jgi:hypothetical protein
MWKKMSDEVREVAPGVYLGVTFQRNSKGRDFRLFFARQSDQQGGKRATGLQDARLMMAP